MGTNSKNSYQNVKFQVHLQFALVTSLLVHMDLKFVIFWFFSDWVWISTSTGGYTHGGTTSVPSFKIFWVAKVHIFELGTMCSL